MKLLKDALNQLSNSTNPSGKHSFIIKKEVISPVFYLFIYETPDWWEITHGNGI